MSPEQNRKPEPQSRPAEAARQPVPRPKKVITIDSRTGLEGAAAARRNPQQEDTAAPLVIPALFAQSGAPGIPEPEIPAPPPGEAAPSPAEIRPTLKTAEDTQDQACAPKGEAAWPGTGARSYAVILPPGRPPHMASIIGIFSETMSLTPREAYQALLHRRGILADGVTREEAERMAERFARAGHAVMLAALTSHVQFGGGLDLISIQERASEVHFATVAETIRAKWRQIVFLAAGQVTIAPGAPPRTLLDIFLAEPHLRLRLWDNAFAYTREAPRFREQAIRITQMAGRAIHTRSLDKWLRDPGEPLRQFDTMLEYESYVRWHLLAHLAPSKLVRF